MKYDYYCKTCGFEKEIEHNIAENPVIVCDKCGEKMKVKISKDLFIHFKGKGFTKKIV